MTNETPSTYTFILEMLIKTMNWRTLNACYNHVICFFYEIFNKPPNPLYALLPDLQLIKIYNGIMMVTNEDYFLNSINSHLAKVMLQQLIHILRALLLPQTLVLSSPIYNTFFMLCLLMLQHKTLPYTNIAFHFLYPKSFINTLCNITKTYVVNPICENKLYVNISNKITELLSFCRDYMYKNNPKAMTSIIIATNFDGLPKSADPEFWHNLPHEPKACEDYIIAYASNDQSFKSIDDMTEQLNANCGR